MQDLHAEVTAAAAAWIDAPESATSTRAYLKQLVQVVQARCSRFSSPLLLSSAPPNLLILPQYQCKAVWLDTHESGAFDTMHPCSIMMIIISKWA